MKHGILYDPKQEPLNIPAGISNLLLQQEKPIDLLALFWFYYHTAKWQGTGEARATNSYVATGLKIPEARVIRGAKHLQSLGLIERTVVRDPISHQVTGHYIKLNIGLYPKAILTKSQGVAFHIIKEKSYIVNIEKINKKEKFDPFDLPPHFAKHPKLVRAWGEFVEYRQAVKRAPITRWGFARIMKQAVCFTPDDFVDAIKRSMDAEWRGLFFRTAFQSKTPAARFDRESMLKQVTDFYDRVPTAPGEDVPHMTKKKFTRRWLEFCEGSGAKTDFDHRLTGWRWERFLRDMGEEIGVDLLKVQKRAA